MKDNWIPVSERLPVVGYYIVAYFNPTSSSEKLYVIPLWRSRGSWYYDNAGKEKAEDSTLRVTHWQNFPPPPAK